MDWFVLQQDYIPQTTRNMEGYDNGSLYAPFLSLKSHSKPELHQGELEEGSKVRSEGCSRSVESSKKKGKKQRYAFQTRSQVDILDDGYRWRKYGQKAVKNNKFPRFFFNSSFLIIRCLQLLYIYFLILNIYKE